LSYYGQNFTGYRGDPGFLSSLGKIFKPIAGIAASVIPGGGIVKAGLGAISTIGKSKAGQIAKGAITVAKSHPVLTAAGGAAIVGTAGAAMGGGRAPAPATMMQLGAGHGLKIGKHGFPVRHKRMRVTNVKALHRAIRRCNGFERLARRVLHISSPHKRHVIKGFRKKRRK